MKALILVILVISGIHSYSQQGNITDVRSTLTVTNEIGKKINCKLVYKFNVIENDTSNYVSMAFSDEFKGGNRGFVYLSNQSELNTFVDDLFSAISHLVNNEIFEAVRPKYKIEVKEYNKYRMSAPYKIKKLCIFETLGGTGESYISFGPDKSNELLNWLTNIKL